MRRKVHIYPYGDGDEDDNNVVGDDDDGNGEICGAWARAATARRRRR